MAAVGLLDVVAVGLLDVVAVGLLEGVLRWVVVGTVVSALYCTLVSFSFSHSLSPILFLPFIVDLVFGEVVTLSVLRNCR